MLSNSQDVESAVETSEMDDIFLNKIILLAAQKVSDTSIPRKQIESRHLSFISENKKNLASTIAGEYISGIVSSSTEFASSHSVTERFLKAVSLMSEDDLYLHKLIYKDTNKACIAQISNIGKFYSFEDAISALNLAEALPSIAIERITKSAENLKRLSLIDSYAIGDAQVLKGVLEEPASDGIAVRTSDYGLDLQEMSKGHPASVRE